MKGMDRSDGGRRQVYQQAVSEEAAEVFAGAAAAMATATD